LLNNDLLQRFETGVTLYEALSSAHASAVEALEATKELSFAQHGKAAAFPGKDSMVFKMQEVQFARYS